MDTLECLQFKDDKIMPQRRSLPVLTSLDQTPQPDGQTRVKQERSAWLIDDQDLPSQLHSLMGHVRRALGGFNFV